MEEAVWKTVPEVAEGTLDAFGCVERKLLDRF